MTRQRIADIRRLGHRKRIAKLCGIKPEEVKLAHAAFVCIFKNMKGVLTTGGNLLIMSRPNKNNLRQLTHKQWLFIEQNPKRLSEFGARALKGESLMWVIDNERHKYQALIANGKVVEN